MCCKCTVDDYTWEIYNQNIVYKLSVLKMQEYIMHFKFHISSKASI